MDRVQPLHQAARVPVIPRFAQCRVCMYAEDHPPPHFHVQMNDGREVWVEIATLAILRGGVATREIADVLTWARQRQAWLAEIFEGLQR